MPVELAQRLITVSEYHKMAETGILTSEDRVELLEGKIIHMSPIGSRHAAYVDLVTKLLHENFGGKAIIRTQNPITLSDFSEPEPDITVLHPRPNFYVDSLPTPEDVLLLIEVSDSSLEKDRDIKLPLYAASGIQEYWIVNIDKKEIEVYQTPLQDQYKLREIFYPDHEITLPLIDKKLKVSSFFID